MTTDTLDEIYSKPSNYDLAQVDKDPFDGDKKQKGRISFLRIAIIISIALLLIAPQIIRLDGQEVEGSTLKATWCRLNVLCHVVKETNVSMCTCPPLIEKMKIE